MGLTCSSFRLQSRLDDVGRCRQVSGRHSSHSSGEQRLKVGELLAVLSLAKEVLLEVGVGREVDEGERSVSEKTRSSSTVEADDTQ